MILMSRTRSLGRIASLSKFYDFAPKTDDDLRRLRLVLRLELDKAIVFGKKIQMDEITREVGNEYGGISMSR
jgi:hypothetical protein